MRIRIAALVIAACTATASPVSGGPSAGQQRSRVAIGDLELTYDAADWRVDVLDSRVVATCLRRGCGSFGLTGGLSAEPASTCSDAALLGEARGHARVATFLLRGIALHLVEIDLGCRNLVPPRIAACVAFAGRVYRFESGPPNCRSGPAGNTQAVTDLLKGLAAP